MAKGINLVVLSGVIGRDAEMKHTPSGKSVSRFSLATTRSKKDQSGQWVDVTDWHDITVWGQDGLIQYLTKGMRVTVSGRIEPRSYEDKDGIKRKVIEIIADEIALGGSKSGDGGRKPATHESAEAGPCAEPDDFVPF